MRGENIKKQNNIHMGLKGRVTRMIARENGEIVKDYSNDKNNNLLLDDGLDQLKNRYLVNMLDTCLLGTGTSEPQVTDVMSDIQNAVTTGSTVTVDNTVGNTDLHGTIPLTDVGDSPFSILYRKTFLFQEGDLDGDYSEIGIAGGRYSYSTLLSRLLIRDETGDPMTITIPSTQSFEVTYELEMTLEPSMTGTDPAGVSFSSDPDQLGLGTISGRHLIQNVSTESAEDSDGNPVTVYTRNYDTTFNPNPPNPFGVIGKAGGEDPDEYLAYFTFNNSSDHVALRAYRGNSDFDNAIINNGDNLNAVRTENNSTDDIFSSVDKTDTTIYPVAERSIEEEGPTGDFYVIVKNNFPTGTELLDIKGFFICPDIAEESVQYVIILDNPIDKQSDQVLQLLTRFTWGRA